MLRKSKRITLTNVIPRSSYSGYEIITLAKHNANKIMPDQSELEASARRLPSAGKDYISQSQVTVDFVVSTHVASKCLYSNTTENVTGFCFEPITELYKDENEANCLQSKQQLFLINGFTHPQFLPPRHQILRPRLWRPDTVDIQKPGRSCWIQPVERKMMDMQSI